MGIGVQSAFAYSPHVIYTKQLNVKKEFVTQILSDPNAMMQIFKQFQDPNYPVTKIDSNTYDVHADAYGSQYDMTVSYILKPNGQYALNFLTGPLEGTMITLTLGDTWGYDGTPNGGTNATVDLFLKLHLDLLNSIALGLGNVVGLKVTDQHIIEYNLDPALLQIEEDAKGLQLSQTTDTDTGISSSTSQSEGLQGCVTTTGQSGTVASSTQSENQSYKGIVSAYQSLQPVSTSPSSTITPKTSSQKNNPPSTTQIIPPFEPQAMELRSQVNSKITAEQSGVSIAEQSVNLVQSNSSQASIYLDRAQVSLSVAKGYLNVATVSQNNGDKMISQSKFKDAYLDYLDSLHHASWINKYLYNISFFLDRAQRESGQNSQPLLSPAPLTSSAWIGGTHFSISYGIVGGEVQEITDKSSEVAMIVTVQTTSDGILTIDLSRSIFDAQLNGQDDLFLVLNDGKEIQYSESKTQTDRTLTIPFTKGTNTIEIIGTQIAQSRAS